MRFSVTSPYLRNWLLLVCVGLVSTATNAADELLLNVFAGGQPVSEATVTIDGETVGATSADGSLLLDLSGAGQRSISVIAEAGEASGRFTAAQGQFVDVIVDIETQDFFVDVYSQ